VEHFDVYRNRHRPFPQSKRVGLHALKGPRPTSELAALAVGGAMAAVASAAVAAQVLDLDALRQASAAEFVSRTGGAHSEHWTDQS
jgi:hypothetical protein